MHGHMMGVKDVQHLGRGAPIVVGSCMLGSCAVSFQECCQVGRKGANGVAVKEGRVMCSHMIIPVL